MNIVKSAKELGEEIESGVDIVTKKVSDTFNNLTAHLPFVNLAKKDDSNFHIEVDLAGVDRDDIDLKVEDDVLVVTAKREFKKELKREDYYICESSFGKIERRFTLPDSVDRTKIDASYEDGRLEIVLHKTQKAKPRTINIK